MSLKNSWFLSKKGEGDYSNSTIAIRNYLLRYIFCTELRSSAYSAQNRSDVKSWLHILLSVYWYTTIYITNKYKEGQEHISKSLTPSNTALFFLRNVGCIWKSCKKINKLRNCEPAARRRKRSRFSWLWPKHLLLKHLWPKHIYHQWQQRRSLACRAGLPSNSEITGLH